MCFEFQVIDHKDIKNAVEKAWEDYPPDEGTQFLICDSKSKFFKER